MADAVVGWPGSGLGAACIARCQQLLDGGEAAERILLLVQNPGKAEKLKHHFAEPVRIETLVGLAARAVAEHWEAVRRAVPDLTETRGPILERDLALYVLERSCALCPRHGPVFEDGGLGADRWDQIGNAAYIAAANGLDLQEIGPRLVRAWAGTEDEARHGPWEALGCCAGQLRAAALASGSLDAATLLWLFEHAVLGLPEFWDGFDHLIVEESEDSPAVALGFYKRGLERLKSTFFAFTVGGGFLDTSVPALVAEFVARHTTYAYLEPANLDSLAWWGNQMARRLSPEFKNPLGTPTRPVRPELLRGRTQIEAAGRMAEQIQHLIDSGVRPGRIAVIAPRDDASLAFVLKSRLGEQVFPLKPSPALVKYPLVRALLGVLELTHPTWGLFPSFPEVQVLLGLLLGIDPVRAEVLAADVFDPVGHTLRPVHSVRFPERVGFDNLERYRLFVEWLDTYRAQSMASIGTFLDRLSRELLLSTLTSLEDRRLVQSLIDLAQRYTTAFPEEAPQHFLALVRAGQGADHLDPPEPRSDQLILSTPLTYIHQDLSADHQFWFDISSDQWWRSAWQKLFNHRVLTPEWNSQPFGEVQDSRHRTHTLARLLFNLCCRTNQKLWLVQSTLNARGEENTGLLDQMIREQSGESIIVASNGA